MKKLTRSSFAFSSNSRFTFVIVILDVVKSYLLFHKNWSDETSVQMSQWLNVTGILEFKFVKLYLFLTSLFSRAFEITATVISVRIKFILTVHMKS